MTGCACGVNRWRFSRHAVYIAAGVIDLTSSGDSSGLDFQEILTSPRSWQSAGALNPTGNYFAFSMRRQIREIWRSEGRLPTLGAQFFRLSFSAESALIAMSNLGGVCTRI
jgi:hypothetical protein